MLFEIKNSFISVGVDSLGAELSHITGCDGTKYLWPGDPEYWSGRSPVLFPICGRLKGGEYFHRGKSYKMQGHGFARDMDFALASKNENSLGLVLKSNDQTRAQYPFDFTLGICYSLEKNRLICRMTVSNTGGDILPFSLGGHPGFNLPLTKGVNFEDYYLEFDSPCTPRRMTISPNYLAGTHEPFSLEDGRILRLSRSLFDFDGIFLTDIPSAVTLKCDKDSRAVRLECPDMSYIGFWQPAFTEPPFLCIEPWRGLPDPDDADGDIMKKPGMIHLEPGACYTFEYLIDLL